MAGAVFSVETFRGADSGHLVRISKTYTRGGEAKLDRCLTTRYSYAQIELSSAASLLKYLLPAVVGCR